MLPSVPARIGRPTGTASPRWAFRTFKLPGAVAARINSRSEEVPTGPVATEDDARQEVTMMNDMMNMMGGMGWGMELISVLIILVLGLGIAALVKYVFFK